ncbi:MAG: DUF4286 family protein [Tannerellaceae bacterium]|jgi:hypothetical protein|nr:DUF4286 family protein [Tannerellaceae bacterium]
MIVYNITFHIDKEVLDESLPYLKEEYIPRMTAGGFLHQPCLRRIMHTAGDEGASYAVQFHVKDMETLNDWLQKAGIAIHEALTRRFGDKMTGFTTLLEEVDWKK